MRMRKTNECIALRCENCGKTNTHHPDDRIGEWDDPPYVDKEHPTFTERTSYFKRKCVHCEKYFHFKLKSIRLKRSKNENE
jgi:hypothetical protein